MADGKQGTQEAWRAYLELAMGVTEASKKKAEKVAKRLAGKGGATAQQLQAFADNLVSTSLANREALTKLVRSEVDRALGAVGLVKADEVAALRARIAELERQVGDEHPGVAVGTAPVPAKEAPLPATKTPAPATKAPAPAKKTPAKKAVAKKAVAKKTTTTESRRVTGKATVAKKVAPPAGMAPE